MPPAEAPRRRLRDPNDIFTHAGPSIHPTYTPSPPKKVQTPLKNLSKIIAGAGMGPGGLGAYVPPPTTTTKKQPKNVFETLQSGANNMGKRRDQTEFERKIDIGNKMGVHDTKSVREKIRQWQANGGGIVSGDPEILPPPPIIPVRSRAGSSVAGSDREGTGGGMWESASEADREVLRERRYKDRERKMRRSKTPNSKYRVAYDSGKEQSSPEQRERRKSYKTDTEWEDAEDGGVRLKKAKTIVVPGDDGIRITPLKRKKTKRRRRSRSPKTSGGEEPEEQDKAMQVYTGGYGADESNLTVATKDMHLERLGSPPANGVVGMPLSRREELGLLMDPNFDATKPVMPEAANAEPKSPALSTGADDGIRVYKGDGIRVYASKRKKKKRQPETETETEERPKGVSLVDEPPTGDVPIVRRRSRRRRRGSPTGTARTGKTDVESLMEELEKAASEMGSNYGSQYGDPLGKEKTGVVNLSGWVPPTRPYSPESASEVAPLRTRSPTKSSPLARSPTKSRGDGLPLPQRQRSNLAGPRDKNWGTRQRPLKREESVKLQGPRAPEPNKLKKKPVVADRPPEHRYDYNTKIEPLQFSRKEAPVAKFLQAKRSAENQAAERRKSSPPAEPAPLKIVKTFAGVLSKAREESSMKRGESLKRSKSKSKKLSVKYSDFSRKDLASRLRDTEAESTDDDKKSPRSPFFLKRDYSVTRKEEKDMLKRSKSKRNHRESSKRQSVPVPAPAPEPPQPQTSIYGYYGSMPPEQVSAVSIPLPESVPSSPELAATVPLPDSLPGSPVLGASNGVVQQPASFVHTHITQRTVAPGQPKPTPAYNKPIEPLSLPKPVVPVPTTTIKTTATPIREQPKPAFVPKIIPMVVEKPQPKPVFPFKLEPPPPLESFPKPDVPLRSSDADSYSGDSYLPPAVNILSEIPEEPSVLEPSILEPPTQEEEFVPQVTPPPPDDENAYIPPGKQLKRFSTIKDAKPMKVKKRVEAWAARIAEEPYVDTFVPEQQIPHGYRNEPAKEVEAHVFPSVTSRHSAKNSMDSGKGLPVNGADARSYETSSRGSAPRTKGDNNSPYASGASGTSRKNKHKHTKHDSHGPKKPKLSSFIQAVKAELLAGRSIRADEVVPPMSGSEARSRSQSRGRSGTSCSTSSCSECKNCVDCMMSSVHSGSKRGLPHVHDLAPPRMPIVHGRSGSRSRSRSKSRARGSERGSERSSERAGSESSRGRAKERKKMQAHADTVSDVSSKPRSEKKKKKDKKDKKDKKKHKSKPSAIISPVASPPINSVQTTPTFPPVPVLAPPKVSPPPPPPPPQPQPQIVVKPESPRPGSPSVLTRTATGTTISESPTSHGGRPTVTPLTDPSSRRSGKTNTVVPAVVPETRDLLQVPSPGPERQASKNSGKLSRKQSRVYQQMETAKTISTADLLTLCSIDVDKPERPKSVRSRQSKASKKKRAKRVAEKVSVDDLLKTLTYEETRYRRELDTLVNDVVPAVIMAALDQTDNDIAKGLQRAIGGNIAGKTINTLPQIMELSTVLNQLQRLHAKIDTTDASKLAAWSRDAVHHYAKYLPAWRQGFQEIIVSVPKYEEAYDFSQDIFTAAGIDPEARKGLESRLDLLAGEADTPEPGEERRTPPIRMKSVKEPEEEKVDVAYLLKRPLVAIKRNAKFFQYLNAKSPTPLTTEAAESWRLLLAKTAARVAEEDQRIEDELAATVVVDQVRSFYSFKQLPFSLDSRNKHVRARDTFQMKMEHPFAGLVEQDVVFILRERKPAAPGPNHEVLVCRQLQGTAQKSLLYPPFSLADLKARLERDGMTVHVRYEYTITDRNTGVQRRMRQMFRIFSAKPGVAKDWARMLGHADDIREIVFEDEVRRVAEEKRREEEEDERLRRELQVRREMDLEAIEEEGGSESESGVDERDATFASVRQKGQSEVTTPVRMDSKSTVASSTGLRRSSAVSRKSSTNPIVRRSSSRRTKSTTISRESSKHSAKSVKSPKYEDPAYENGLFAMPTTTLNDIPELAVPETRHLDDTTTSESDDDGHQAESEGPPPPPPPHRVPSRSKMAARRTKSPSISESLRIKPHIALKPVVIAPSKRPGVGRRNSSPLKHEYQPSIASAMSHEEFSQSEEEYDDEEEHFHKSSPRPRPHSRSRSHSGSEMSVDDYRTSASDDTSSISSTSDGSEDIERSFKSLSIQHTDEEMLKPPPAVKVDELDTSDFTTTSDADTSEDERRAEAAKLATLSRQVSHRSQKSHHSRRSHHSQRSRKSIRDVRSEEELDEERDYAMPLMIIEPRNKLHPTRKLSIIKTKQAPAPVPDSPKQRPAVGLNGYATLFVWKDGCRWELEVSEELRVRITFGKLELHLKREDDDKLLLEAQNLARAHPNGDYETPEIFTRKPTFCYTMPYNTTVMSGSTGLDVSLANIIDTKGHRTRIMFRCRNQFDANALRDGFRNFTPSPPAAATTMIPIKPIRTMEELEAEDAALAAKEVRRGWNALGRNLSFRSGPKASIASSGASSKSFSSAISNFVKKKRFFGSTTIDQSSAASDETSTGSATPPIQILDYDGSAPIINAVKATCYSKLAGTKDGKWVRAGPVYLTVFNRRNNPNEKRVIASIRKKNEVVFDRVLDRAKFERTARKGVSICVPVHEEELGDHGWGGIRQNYFILKFQYEREAAFVFGVVGRTDGRGY
ncbi:hypothetical protein BJ508DRAFT_141738 [Ascobolus immersus RN42]|uniref:Uncharacterized protein n=1 Tax=Ascobolus immersus RN42 TaxID=1160509 RepID=A0A3N4I552_ASCIM|nr:hypothetical protein BJ508DRAFT_141738 [Ascobolus immersus RN42]